MIAMKILKTVLDTWGYRELFMWNKKITSYDEIQKFDVKKQRWASRTDTRTFKYEFAVSELVENELGPLGRWNYSETIFILNTVIPIIQLKFTGKSYVAISDTANSFLKVRVSVREAQRCFFTSNFWISSYYVIFLFHMKSSL